MSKQYIITLDDEDLPDPNETVGEVIAQIDNDLAENMDFNQDNAELVRGYSSQLKCSYANETNKLLKLLGECEEWFTALDPDITDNPGDLGRLVKEIRKTREEYNGRT